ncbi:polymer-forming cytoskeletal protein [Novosphingobium sp. KCTC 2891]|uniref:bactofilin family protein n=1 Tax=Novosphingobium sp. KCTC 2891 TaxID=2989730 RepID=UPI00222219D7|nr:polymer-forming cytoskeletal protein [Novosphingobium sp. KCTC 2891]MCW1382322.1 polymer-forming cytoskeletal protein [Novosphingobium sp. KCTC 2891]
MFSKKPAPDGRTAAGARPVAAGTFSILGADIVVKGDIVASADLHIDGTVEGDIACAALVQGEGSTIRGAIRAKSARLSGTVHGGIEAAELVILKTARIEGDVTYDALTIEQGAQVDGRFAHRVAENEAALSLVG